MFTLVMVNCKERWEYSRVVLWVQRHDWLIGLLASGRWLERHLPAAGRKYWRQFQISLQSFNA